MSDTASQITRFSIDGPLTLRGAAAAHEQLLGQIASNDDTRIEIPADQDVDVCGLQLIEAARLYAASSGKVLALHAPADGKLLQVLELAGFIEGASDEDRAFWLHEGKAS